MVITIIGNKTNSNNDRIADGGRVKVDTYYQILKEEGFSVRFIELEGWKRNVFLLIKSTKKAVKNSDVVLIMGGPRGSRILITLCALFNKKKKTRIVYSMLGVGTIQQKIKYLTPQQITKFLSGDDNFNIKDARMGKKLSKLDMVLAENEIQSRFYKIFYGLPNVEVMENFRIVKDRRFLNTTNFKKYDKRNFVFFSRVNKEKGIFDAIEAIKKVNKEKEICTLDIYGDLQLNEEEKKIFESSLDNNIKYLGIIDNKRFIEILSKYDFMIFPSTYHGEGTPGVIMEAFISGLPVLSSNFPQASELIDVEYDGLLFESKNIESLVEKIKFIISLTSQELEQFKNNAYESGNKFTYEYVRKRFLYYITGNIK